MIKKFLLSFSLLFTSVALAQSPFPPPPTPTPVVPTPVVPQPVPAPNEVKIPASIHVAVRMKLRQHYRAQGKGIVESIRLANQASDDVIAGLLADAEKLSGQSAAEVIKIGNGQQLVGALGDGQILQKIIDFFNSPAGKALIEALIQLLIHALGAHDSHDMIHEMTVFTLALPPPHSLLFSNTYLRI